MEFEEKVFEKYLNDNCLKQNIANLKALYLLNIKLFYCDVNILECFSIYLNLSISKFAS